MEDYWRVRYRARASTSSLKSNRDPLPPFLLASSNHSPQGKRLKDWLTGSPLGIDFTEGRLGSTQ
jgi:hypothetical protein